MPAATHAKRSSAILLALLLGCDPAPPITAPEPPPPDLGPLADPLDVGPPLPFDACVAAQRDDAGPNGRVVVGVIDTWPPRVAAACNNAADDDGDGLIDWPEDPGCFIAGDRDEADDPSPTACSNGLDDDGDGLTDWPDDPECPSRGGRTEALACAAGPVVPLDGDSGVIVLPVGGERSGTRHPGCSAPEGSAAVLAFERARPSSLRLLVVQDYSDDLAGPPLDSTRLAVSTDCDDPAATLACSEGPALVVPQLPAGPVRVFVHGPDVHPAVDDLGPMAPPRRIEWRFDAPFVAACADGRDNDEDGAVDAADPGCRDADDDVEHDPPTPPQCADRVDGDGDGALDWPDDPDCAAAGAIAESACPDDGIPLLGIGDTLGLFDLPELPDSACADTPVRVLRVASAPGRRPGVRLVSPNGFEVTADLGVAPGCDARGALVCLERSGRRPHADAPGIETWHVTPSRFGQAVERPETLRVEVFDAMVDVGRYADDSACGNGLDDDGDGLADAADPDCASRADVGEAPLWHGAPPACDNGVDDDGDGATDWPADVDCLTRGDPYEAPVDCVGGPIADVVDASGGWIGVPADPGDEARGSCQPEGRETVEIAVPLHLSRSAWVRVWGAEVEAVHLRTDCADPASEVLCAHAPDVLRNEMRLSAGERWLFIELARVDSSVRVDLEPRAECSDGLDNDGDGRADLADEGCADPLDPEEGDGAGECGNGLDDDGDGRIDWPADPQCTGFGARAEAGCGGRPFVHALAELELFDGVEIPRSAPLPLLLPNQFDPGPTAQTAFELALVAGDRIVRATRILGGNRPIVARTCAGGDAVDLTQLGESAWVAPESGRYWVIVEWRSAFESSLPFIVERRRARCSDGLDNDGDGLVDRADPGCAHDGDTGEADGPTAPACGDGLDGDGDGSTDWPADRQCQARGDDAEGLVCGASARGALAGSGRIALGPDAVEQPRLTSRCRYAPAWDTTSWARVVQLVVDTPSRLELATEHSTFSPVLSLRCDCHVPGATSEIQCARGHWPLDEARLTVADLPAGTYAIVVDGWQTASDRTVVSVELTPL